MKAWDIAKLLMERCNSREDVDQVIVTLKNPEAMQEVYSMLATFSNGKPAIFYPDADVPTIPSTRRPAPTSKVSKAVTEEGPASLTDISKVATADQLESIFRASGMTNKQVEQWITDKFNISVTMGKGSLRKYLTKLLSNADLGLSNRILSSALRLQKSDLPATSDIENFWDELDKRFSIVE